MSRLGDILTRKRAEIAELRTRPLPVPPPLRKAALRRAPGSALQLITEIKRRSPSAGPLSTRLSVGERARCYEQAGASMVSVLCDTAFFDGAYEHLELARASCNLPLLCKEFILDDVQLEAARAFGADAALLIVRCLPNGALPALMRKARELGLQPLVEVTSEAEAERALDAGADWIGVNARDLDTLVVDQDRARRVLSQIPASVVRIHLSGISSAEAVAQLSATGIDAALLGEVLMRQDDPGALLQTFRQNC